jgi:hypothetical protein
MVLRALDDDGDGVMNENNVDGNVADLRYIGAVFDPLDSFCGNPKNVSVASETDEWLENVTLAFAAEWKLGTSPTNDEDVLAFDLPDRRHYRVAVPLP